MSFRPVFALMSRVREEANALIVSELEKAGICGIAPSHGDIFVVLFQNDGCSMSDIAERIHRTKSTVTTLIAKLEEKRYVIREKNAGDGRGVNVYLTDKGRALKPCIDNISQRLHDVFLNRFSEEEADTLERLLRKLLEK